MRVDASIDRQARAVLERCGALRKGHFLLSSVLHSDRYCQCAKALEDPKDAARLAELMKELMGGSVGADIVLAPALGGVVWGFALASAIGARSIFAERPDGESFRLRRGFELRDGERVLLAEDVVTTGGSVMQLVPIVEQAGAEVAGFATIVDRSKGSFDPGGEVFALARLEFETYEAGDCPMCASGSAAEKPGSSRLDGARR